MAILPGYRFARFRFYTPMGVENVRVRGARIAGDWKEQTVEFYSDKEKTIAERFANWGWEAARIALFTSRFGPLTSSPVEERHFTFTLESWRHNQWELRKFWCDVRDERVRRVMPFGEYEIEFRNGWLHFGCGSLYTFMMLEILSEEAKLRFCERPDCAHPYFMAQHGKERYCSTDCANWSQSQLKKRWHEQQRLKRKKEGG